jgi:NADPH oxidase 1
MVIALVHLRGYGIDPGRYKQTTDARLAGLNQIGLSVAISRGAGLILTIDTALILLPICRNLIRALWVRWLPFEKSHALHRHIAYVLLFWAAVHTAAHYVK